ncbi:protein Skeletor, isoforms B/C-like [Acanthaster planci]|uniref:Protein Skeletor, isoforms B/C-like n=1 Tax=Acanthaster planci TaxID=133434 RepID=A0A8B7Y482_ACAPL|nr:protein Skeletor, isoforms B/C-like [Acanthaster planci]
MAKTWITFIVLSALISSTFGAKYGKRIGEFGTRSTHGVSGTVFAANKRTIVIERFSFDGTANTVFLIGKSATPSTNGTEVPVVPLGGAAGDLGEYLSDLLVLVIPGIDFISEYKYIAVWNRDNQGESYGSVAIPDDFIPPAPHALGDDVLVEKSHKMSVVNIIVEDAKTVSFIGLSYDGLGPAVFFWAGHAAKPDINGTALLWRDTVSQLVKQIFRAETVTVSLLPGNPTIPDYSYISMWCSKFHVSFGHFSPVNTSSWNVPPSTDTIRVYDNCQVLSADHLQVRWSVKGGVIEVQLSGKIPPNSFMAFGVSGGTPEVRGSDVAVAWVNSRNMTPTVVDYHMQTQSQCSMGSGACPDDVAKPTAGTTDVALTSSSTLGGVTRISYSRYLDTGDPLDKVIPTDKSVYVVWAVGPVKDGHTALFNQDTIVSASTQINFGRSPSDTCPELINIPPYGAEEPPAWPTLEIQDRDQFRLDIGPAGGVRGYSAITGKRGGWKYSWYVDGLLVPVIKLQRGKRYVFNVFGGNDPMDPGHYHPLYLTSSDRGGYAQLSEEEKKGEVIYADKQTGPLCRYIDDGSHPDDFESFGGYQAHLTLDCNERVIGGLLEWTPDSSTPDTVYYQSYTHFGMGFRIDISSSAAVPTVSVRLVIGLLLAATLK